MGIEAAIIGSSIIGAGAGLIGNRRAADAQADANAASIAEQRRQFDTILGLTAPQRQVGNAALNTLASAFIPGFSGLNIGGASVGGASGASPQYLGGMFGRDGRIISNDQLPPALQSASNTLAPVDANSLSQMFRNLPGVQFELGEVKDAVGNSFASRGGAFSGNAITALGDRVGNIASARAFNPLFQLAGFGNQGVGTSANAATNMGNNISQLLSNTGAARASGFQGAAGSINNAVQGGLQNWLLMKALGA